MQNQTRTLVTCRYIKSTTNVIKDMMQSR